MNVNNFSLPLMAYVESSLLPHIENSLEKWMTYAGLLLKMPGLERKIQEMVPTLKEFGAVSESGDIDFEKIKTVGLAAFDKVPTVSFAGFNFDRNDFEAFVTFMKTQG